MKLSQASSLFHVLCLSSKEKETTGIGMLILEKILSSMDQQKRLYIPENIRKKL